MKHPMRATRPPLVLVLHRDPGTLLPGAPILSEEEGWAGLAQAVIALLKARRARRALSTGSLKHSQRKLAKLSME